MTMATIRAYPADIMGVKFGFEALVDQAKRYVMLFLPQSPGKLSSMFVIAVEIVSAQPIPADLAWQ